MRTYICTIECEFDANSPEEAAQMMLAEMDDPRFDPTIEVTDWVLAEVVGQYDSSDFPLE